MIGRHARYTRNRGCYVACGGHMLAKMSEIDPRALDWSEAGMNEPLPTGTVTLLLADVQGSTQLWQSRPGK